MSNNPAGSSGQLSRESIDDFSKQVLSALMETIKVSAALPSAGDDFDLYSSFSGFRAFGFRQGESILGTINKFLQHQGLKCLSISGQSSIAIGIDDKFDRIMDANDTMLERIGALLDRSKSTKKSDANSTVPAVENSPVVTAKTIVSSWNKKNRYGKQQTFRLFHAHNIARPQLKFKDKIDNSNVPFVPKICEKLNATKPLPQALVDLQKDDSSSDISLAIANLVRQGRRYVAEDQSIYDHPYRAELTALKYPEHQLMEVVPKKYDAFPDEPSELIDTKEELMPVIEHLKTCQEFAVDLEHHSYRSFQGITCLMQLSSRTKDFLIDTLKLRSEIYRFNVVFTNPKIVKVFHGADSDIQWLQRDFGVYVVNMFDTGQAARELGLGRFSLDFLLLKYCGVHADKKYQLADWRIRPIPTEMRKYAQEDTHYLLYVYDVMKNTLLHASSENQPSETGATRLLNVLSRSKEICLQKYEKYLVKPTSYLQLYERQHKKQLNPNQLELLRLLFSWRDTLSRQEDESPGYVLPKHMLFQIAEIMPREAQGVLACCNPVPPLVRQHVHVIHQLVLEARAKAFNKTPNAQDQEVSKVPVPAKPEVETYGDILTCPHDTSHAHGESNTMDDFSSNVRTSVHSCLFKAAERISVPEKQTVNGKTTDRSTWNPFDKFLAQSKMAPRKLDGNGAISVKELTIKTMLGPGFVWRLRNLEPSCDNAEDVPVKNTKKERTKEEELIVLKGTGGPKRTVGQRSHQNASANQTPSKMQKLAGRVKDTTVQHSSSKPYVYQQSQYNRFK